MGEVSSLTLSGKVQVIFFIVVAIMFTKYSISRTYHVPKWYKVKPVSVIFAIGMFVTLFLFFCGLGMV